MDLSDIQGLVFYGYEHEPFARYYLCSFAAEHTAREWLSGAYHRVSSAHHREREYPSRLNVAFTAGGLVKLGLDESALLEFSREFVQGMQHPERSIALGDSGEDAPEHWDFGGARGPALDALILLYCETPAALAEEHAALSAELERHGVAFRCEDAYVPADGREHFGFAHGVAQPVVKGGPVRWRKNPFDPRLAPGEVLLGHKNGYGQRPISPEVPLKPGTRELPPRKLLRPRLDFGNNGTYLVLRKLEQDVAGFWRHLEARALRAGAASPLAWAEEFAARLIGRWPDGRPLALAPNREDPCDDPNRFGYRATDRGGPSCPIGAHIRRVNPRDALGPDGEQSLVRTSRHRILRRGRLYEEWRGGERAVGLMFMALNANLRRQFEHLQRAWVSDPKFRGLRFRERTLGLSSFVRVRGGGYFFLPSLRALAYLAET